MRKSLPLVALLPVLLAVLALVLVQPVQPSARASAAEEATSEVVPGRLLVQLPAGVRPEKAAEGTWRTGNPPLDAALAAEEVADAVPLFHVGEDDDPYGLSRIYLLALVPGGDVLRAVDALSAVEGVGWAEPDYLARAADMTPDDPLFPQQWGLAQIEAPAAWDVVTGSQAVVIAVVDSGLDFSHPDLSGQIWINPAEIAGNGLDDDNNGYVDDVNGWDFVNGDNDPADDNGHGTQVAGIAAAATDNGLGIAGLCWECRVMPVKVMQASGAANYSDVALGVLYAAQKGAEVINLSLGGYSYSSALHVAIQAAVGTYGAVVVGGAGNDNVATPFCPAAYPEVLAVAGTDQADAKAAFSDYGEWVDLSAPAVAIMTTFSGGDWGAVNGTSFAAPFVSGLAGLVRSLEPGWSPALVRAQLLHTADPIDALNPGYEGLLGSGRVNAAEAVTQVPAPLLEIAATAVNGDPLGRPVPGESATLQVTLGNDWLDATSVAGTLTTSDPYVTITQGTASFGGIPAGSTGTGSPLYTFAVAPGAGYNHSIAFALHVTANGGAYTASLPLTITTRSAEEPVSGTIGADTTWTSDKTWLVTANVGVAPGVTLTIEAGTVVEFSGNYSLNVGGTLVADGTEAAPIRFRPHAGGTWNRIYFDDSSTDAVADEEGNYQSGNILRWVQVEGAASGIGCIGATPFLSHVTSTGGGVTCTAGATAFWLLNSSLTGDVSIASGAAVSPSALDRGGSSFRPPPTASGATWAKLYGAPGEDVVYFMVPAIDGGYVTAGGSSSGAGGWDVWITKVDSAGRLQWHKTYGGPGNEFAESAYAIATGGYIVAGYTTSFGAAGVNAWLLRLDELGNVVWQKAYGENGEDVATAVRCTGDDGFVFAGSLADTFWLVRLDALGNVVWQRTYGSPSSYPSWLYPTADGGYVLAGSTYAYGAGDEDAWVLKLDAAGDIDWQKAFGGTLADNVYVVYPAADGYILSGYTKSYGFGNGDAWLLKLTQQGDVAWAKAYGDTEFDSASSVYPTGDGGFVAVGRSRAPGSASDDGWVFKLSSVGDILWQQTYHVGGYVGLLAVYPTDEGGYAVGGQESLGGGSPQDLIMMRLDSQGQLGDYCSIVGGASAIATDITPTVTDTSADAEARTVAPTASVATVLDSPSTETLVCSDGLPSRIHVRQVSISAGSLAVPDETEVLDSAVDGALIGGDWVHIIRSVVAGSITTSGTSSIEECTAGGSVSTASGLIRSTIVAGGSISIGSGHVLSNTLTGGGISAGDGSLVQGNDVEGAPGWSIKAGGTVTVTANRLVGNAQGIQTGGGTVQGNLVANSAGTGLEIDGNTVVTGNTFTGNAGSAVKIVAATSLQVTGNNLEFNTGPYDIENLVPKATMASIPAQGNWWGTTDPGTIAGRIYDYYDDYNMGTVAYSPPASGPVQEAPAYVRSVTLTPESPVGIETVQFDVQFSRGLDTSCNPLLRFVTTQKGTWQTYNNSNSGLASDDVLGSVVDPLGNKWFCTFGGGVSVLHPDGTWTTYNTANSGLASDAPLNVAFDADGGMWFGTQGSGVSTLHADGTWQTYNSSNSGLAYNHVCGVAVDPAGNKWFGTFGAGVSVLRADGSWQTYDTSNSGLLDNKIHFVESDATGNIWVTSEQGGASVLRTDGTWQTYTTANSGLALNNVLPVMLDAAGSVWLGTYGAGVSVLHANGMWHTYNSSNSGLVEGHVYAIAQDGAGNTWFGTEFGGASVLYADGTWQSFTTSNSGLPNNDIRALAVDDVANKWFSVHQFGVSLLRGGREYSVEESPQWLAPDLYRAVYEINSLVPRDTYRLTVEGAVGGDGIEIAPNSATTFVVDWAGGIGDDTPPPPPIVEACAGTDAGTLFASWTASDPDSAITLYRYAIGTVPEGTDVVNWTNTADTSFARGGLGLIAGQTYYVSVKARNEGGLWSEAASAGAVAGSGECGTSVQRLFLPSVLRHY